MIKNVNEIVAITKKAHEDILARRHETTMTYINNTIARELERAAEAGETGISFRVDKDIDRDLIKEVVEAEGYDISIKGYDVKIDWLMKFVKKNA